MEVIVIGGGFSGLGVALEAAARGHSVTVLERNSCVSGTSAHSLRIVHGGLRYLQTLSIARCIESIRAQAQIATQFPQFVSALPCFLPLKATGFRSRWPVKAAVLLYETLRSVICGDVPRETRASVLSAAQTKGLSAGNFPRGALRWVDYHIDDLNGFVHKLRDMLIEQGVTLREGCEVVSIQSEERSARVTIKQDTKSLGAHYVIDTRGPHTALGGRQQLWTRGFNLVLSKQLEARFGLAVQSGKRALFAVPRGKLSAIGTWYVGLYDSPPPAEVAPEEIQLALKEFITGWRVLTDDPGFELTQSEIAAVEVGVLPAQGGSVKEPVLVGRELLYQIAPRILAVVSTKLTTFPEQAKRICEMMERTKDE